MMRHASALLEVSVDTIVGSGGGRGRQRHRYIWLDDSL